MPAQLHKSRLTPVALAVFATLTSPQLLAQSTDQKTEQSASQEVVVSGSRIKRDNYNSASPVQIIRADDALAAGMTTTTEMLQSTAVTGGQPQVNNAYGGYVTEGGPGVNTLGLRGYRPTRSLILLNGRRMAPSGTRGSVGATDLNTLPSSIVDRIEVLKDGASSIYGSDAVAGVVNIITKKNLTGVTTSLTQTQPEQTGGASTNFSLAGGIVRDNFRFSGSYQLTDRKELTYADRDWTRCPIDYTRRVLPDGTMGGWGSGDFIDPKTGQPKCWPLSVGVTVNTIGTGLAIGVPGAGAQGLLTSPANVFNRWRPNASVTTGIPGYEGVNGGSAGQGNNARDTYDPRMLNRSIITPVQNHNFYAQGGVDLNALGNAELYFETLINRRESSSTQYRQFAWDYKRGSPLIPASLQPFSATDAPLISGFGPVGIRVFTGFGNYTDRQTVDFNRTVVGLRGQIDKTGWEYDISAVQSNNKGVYTFPSFLEKELAQSLDVVSNGAGGFVCKDPSGGCVAAPALTAAVVGGQYPQNWIDYIYRNITGVSKFKETVVTASATGDLFKMPYGKAKAAFGVELRKNSIDDTPGPEMLAQNLYGFSTSQVTRGSDSAKDVFAEFELPLLKNLPGARDLTINASGRWADYKSYGKGNTYKLSTLWSPEKWLTLRGTTGTSYRAPALYEQFLGPTSGFIASGNDPCVNYGNRSATDARRINCASEGLPPNFQQLSSVTVYTLGGRSAGLKPETSKNMVFGGVIQPELPSGWGDLSLAVDRFTIEVNNGVTSRSGSSILSGCYTSPNANFLSDAGDCGLVRRDPSSGRLFVESGYINLSRDIVHGVDYTARYTNTVGAGRLTVNFAATKYNLRASPIRPSDPVVNYNGVVAYPSWTSNVDFNYALKDWSFFYGLEMVGGQEYYSYYGFDEATFPYQLRTPDYFRHNVSVRYNNPVQKWSVLVGVRNLTDVKPPFITPNYTNNTVGNAPLSAAYDYVGRTFFVNVNKSF
jgi:iron complex outermembrane receptor protein